MQMFKYVLKRLAYSIVTLFVLVALTFFLQHMLPGDPFIGDKALPEATMEALRAKYGLDKSLPEQFLIYLGNCLRGDLGLSIQNNRPVTTIIYESFLVSFDLGIRAIIFALILGVFLGTVAAIKRGKAIDTVCMFIALVGVSVPSFIMASLLQYFLGLQLTTALKGAGMSAMFAATGWEAPNSKILPVLALGFGSLAQISRLTRTSMLDVLGQDYIKTARAKGLREKTVIYIHAFRNALIPVVTITTWWIIGLFGGSIVIESVFLIPGLGKMLIDSLMQRDFAVVLTMQMFYVVLSLAGNVLMDIAYTLVDPRVRLEN